MNTTDSIAGLALRVLLGTVLIAHGLLKLLVFTMAGAVGFFESVGFPGFFAYLTVFVELLGGTALILGIYVRLFALASLPIMLGATWVHWGNGWVFSNQGGGWEFPAVLAVLAVIVAIQGAGKYAIRSIPGLDILIPSVLRA